MRARWGWVIVAVACSGPEPDRGGGPGASDPGSTVDPFSDSWVWDGQSTTSTTPPTAPQGCFTLKHSGYTAQSIARIPTGGGEPVPHLSLATPLYAPHSVEELTWFDGAWVACDGELLIIDGATGQVRRPDVWCDLVAEISGELWVQTGWVDWEVYQYLADLEVAAPAYTMALDDWGSGISRAGSGGAVMYGAWHSTDVVQARDMVTTDTWEIQLEGFDTWVWGIEEEGGILRLLDDGRGPTGDVQVVRFDAATGQQVGVDVVATTSAYDLNGLWCAPGAP